MRNDNDLLVLAIKEEEDIMGKWVKLKIKML